MTLECGSVMIFLRQRLGDLRIGWVIVEMSAKVTPILASMQVIHCRKSRRKPGDSCRCVGCRCGDVRPCDCWACWAACPRGSPAAEVAKWEIRKKLRKSHGPWPKGGRRVGRVQQRRGS